MIGEWIDDLRYRLRALLRPGTVERELADELAHHLQVETERRVREGVAPDEARRQAALAFGNVEHVKELSRDARGIGGLTTVSGDVRHALRRMRREPVLAVVIVLSLALGIGANTAIFTVIKSTMLEELPVRDAESLVMLTQRGSAPGKGFGSFPDEVWLATRERQDVFTEVFAQGSTQVELSRGGEARRGPVSLVSGNFFSALGVTPALGRLLDGSDDKPGCAATAVLSYAFWHSELGGNRNVIGQSMTMEGQPVAIVGVAARGFFGIEFGYPVRAWLPLCVEPIIRGPGGVYRGSVGRMIVGRVRPGLTPAQVEARLDVLAPSILEQSLRTDASPAARERHLASRFGVMAFSRGIPALRMSYGKALFILMGVVGAVLLVACANVANLLLARATTRQRELAVRLALGASRGRLVRQLLVESLMLSIVGASLGLLVARWGSRGLVSLMSSPRNAVALDLSPDVPILAFTLGAGVLTGVLFGLLPAWRAVRVDPQVAMKPGGRGVTEGHTRFRVGKALVVTQIALSLLMLTGAGLLVGSWRRLATEDPGFEARQVLVAQVDTRGAGLTQPQLVDVYRRLTDRMAASPTVASVGAALRIPIGQNSWSGTVEGDGIAPTPVEMSEVGDGYFPTLGTPIVTGRDFARRDNLQAPRVVIVSQALATALYGTISAIGRQIRVPIGNTESPPLEIVGVAGDTKLSTLRDAPRRIVYLPLNQNARPGPYVNMIVRTTGNPTTAMPEVRRALSDIDPRFTASVFTLEQQLAESLRLERVLGLLSGFFGVLALLLAGLGLYGIVTYMTARRRGEIGVRIALGAQSGRVVRMVLGEAGLMVLIGIGVGVALSLALTRLVASFLYGVTPHDPLTLGAAAMVLVVVAVGAAAAPARRAARSDPVAALRADG